MKSHDITLITLSLGYNDRKAGTIYRYVPLGPLYLTSVLEQQGYHVDWQDFQLEASREPSDTDSTYRLAVSENRCNLPPAG